MTGVLLAGLATVDILQRVPDFPAGGQKVVSTRLELATGGPASNAAVTAAALGCAPTLVTGLGRHPLAELARADLLECGVALVDLVADRDAPPTVSSVLVRDSDGERSVASDHARGWQLPAPAATDWPADVAAVLLDGHHPELAVGVARQARDRGLPVVLDAGTYRPVFDEVLALVDVCACSESFRLPGHADDTEQALLDRGVPVVTRTHGAGPVRWHAGGRTGEVEVPVVRAVDTLGAGDAWHGALVAGVARLGRVPGAADLPALLATANRVAAVRVQHVGARSWLAAVRELAR